MNHNKYFIYNTNSPYILYQASAALHDKEEKPHNAPIQTVDVCVENV